MQFYLYLALGFLGGIPAGMGMGGGTITIPLLVLFGGVEQKIAQCANLFSFLPMSGFAVQKHAQNGLLKTQGIFSIVLPALFGAAGSSLIVRALASGSLKRAFGLFLIVLSVLTLKNTAAGEQKQE